MLRTFVVLLLLTLVAGCPQRTEVVAVQLSDFREDQRMAFLLACPKLIQAATTDQIANTLIALLGENRMQGWCHCAFAHAVQEVEPAKIQDLVQGTAPATDLDKHRFSRATLVGLSACSHAVEISNQEVKALLEVAANYMDEKNRSAVIPTSQ